MQDLCHQQCASSNRKPKHPTGCRPGFRVHTTCGATSGDHPQTLISLKGEEWRRVTVWRSKCLPLPFRAIFFKIYGTAPLLGMWDQNIDNDCGPHRHTPDNMFTSIGIGAKGGNPSAMQNKLEGQWPTSMGGGETIMGYYCWV